MAMSDSSLAPRTIEIRNNFHGNFLSTYPFVLAAGMLAFYLVYALFVAPITGRWFAVLALCFLLIGVAVYTGRKAFDTHVQVVLSPEGFRDHRMGDILVPWSLVVRGTLSTVSRGSMLVFFHLGADPDPRTVLDIRNSSDRIRLMGFDAKRIALESTSLEMSGRDILKAAKAFAPHIEIDMRRM
jgi:hypothetical protein